MQLWTWNPICSCCTKLTLCLWANTSSPPSPASSWVSYLDWRKARSPSTGKHCPSLTLKVSDQPWGLSLTGRWLCWRNSARLPNPRTSTRVCGNASCPILLCGWPLSTTFCSTSIANRAWRTRFSSWDPTSISWSVTNSPQLESSWSYRVFFFVQVEALCISVQDQSVLVQRSALDLLLVAFPMHNSQLTRTDMVRLCASAIKVVLRRDMSLNRRLYAWLLGTDAGGNPLPVRHSPPWLLLNPSWLLHNPCVFSSQGVTFPAAEKPPTKDRPDNVSMCSEPEMDYFLHFSRGLLISGIKACIHECHELDSIINGKPANLRPFRILISLLDRPEIGSSILEDILIDVFRCMYRECLILSSSNLYHGDLMRNGMHRVGKKKDLKTRREDRMLMVEVIKTANLLFGAFEPNYIWDFIGRTFEKSCAEADQNRHFVMGEGDASLTELCLLVDFLLDKVSLVSELRGLKPRFLTCVSVFIFVKIKSYTLPSELSHPRVWSITEIDRVVNLLIWGSVFTQVCSSLNLQCIKIGTFAKF